MTAELTSEQIVTNLLTSNEILKSDKGYTDLSPEDNLGEFLLMQPYTPPEPEEISRYAFINLKKGWDF